MAELVFGVSQSSLLVLDRSKSGFQRHADPSRTLRLQHSSNNNAYYQTFVVLNNNNQRYLKPTVAAARVLPSDSKSSASTIVTNNVDLATEGIDIQEPDTGSGGDGYGDLGGGGGGGGGGGDGGDNSGHSEGEGGSSDDSGGEKGKKMFTVSQKLTLGYAALVGLGGLVGYLKSGSQKSLLAGGLSSSILLYVFTQLPTNTVYAASIGLGVSAALTGVMGSRFMRSGKIFPAGVVSLVSLVMTAGYLHGIMRGMH